MTEQQFNKDIKRIIKIYGFPENFKEMLTKEITLQNIRKCSIIIEKNHSILDIITADINWSSAANPQFWEDAYYALHYAKRLPNRIIPSAKTKIKLKGLK